MTDATTTFLASLEYRRRQLGLQYEALAERSGTSRATVIRLLKSKQATARMDSVVAVAEALGVVLQFKDGVLRSRAIDVDSVLEQQAERQAQKLVRMVQGTMGLEAQAIKKSEYLHLLKKTKLRLLAGSKRKLWST